jgi:hypothetical protein
MITSCKKCINSIQTKKELDRVSRSSGSFEALVYIKLVLMAIMADMYNFMQIYRAYSAA